MKLFALHPGNIDERVQLIREAAKSRDIEFIPIDVNDGFPSGVAYPQKGDMLLNCGRGGEHAETLLWRPDVASLRPRYSGGIVSNQRDSTILSACHERLGLPGPKTEYLVPREPTALLECVDRLGGFPIVLKTVAGSKGDGIVICESEASLLSTVDFARLCKRQFFLREYIDAELAYRVLLIDGEFVCAIARARRAHDFRSDGNHFEIVEIDQDALAVAIAAAAIANMDWAGVDLLFHPTRGWLVLEVNPPCDFVEMQSRTGIDIAGKLVDALMRRTKNCLASPAEFSFEWSGIRAERAGVLEIRRLHTLWKQAMVGVTDSDMAWSSARFADHIQAPPPHGVWTLKRGESLEGFVTFTQDAHPTRRTGLSCEMGIALLPSMQGLGLAAALADALFDYAAKLGVQTVVSTVRGGNARALAAINKFALRPTSIASIRQRSHIVWMLDGDSIS